ncbi:MAG: hypothetical protein U1E38_00495 [Rhodospirillales bacterium]
MAGVLEIVATEGSDVAVGAVLGIIGEAAGATAARPRHSRRHQSRLPLTAATCTRAGRQRWCVSPAVRKLIGKKSSIQPRSPLPAGRPADQGRRPRLPRDPG